MSLTIAPARVPLYLDDDGVVRIEGTRVTLDTVIGEFLDGATPEDIAADFPSLRRADVYALIAYYLQHQAEVDTYLEQRRAQAAAIRSEIEGRWNPAGVRDRLLARRQNRERPDDPISG